MNGVLGHDPLGLLEVVAAGVQVAVEAREAAARVILQVRKTDIGDKVEKILNTPNLRCPEADFILEALDLYVTKNIDFIDAYHAIALRDAGVKTIFTYDKKHFGRVDWLVVTEP